MNTKGTKFLAVLAVLAMAFAAFAVVSTAEENDADAIAFTDLPAGGALTADGNYFIGSDTTVSAATDVTAKFYVKVGAAVTIGANITAEVYWADGTTAGETTDGSTLIADGITVPVSKNVTIKATAADAATVDGDVLTIANVAAAGVSVATQFTVASVTLVENLVYAGAAFFNTEDASEQTVYTKVALGSYQFNNDADQLIVKSGNTTIMGGTNVVKLDNYGEAAFTSEVGLTFDYTAATYLIEAKGTMATGVLTVTAGSITMATGGVTQTDGASEIVGVANADLTTSTLAETKILGFAPDATHSVILGHYTHPDKNPKVNQGLTVGAKAVFTIPAKSTFTYGNKDNSDVAAQQTITITAGGILDVWGILKGINGVAATDYSRMVGEGMLKIRAGAEVSGFVTDAGVSTLVAATKEVPAVDDADLQGLSGSLDASMTITNAEVPSGKKLTIPEGITLTVTGMLVVNGHLDTESLVVNGTLIINDGAMLAVNDNTCGITLGEKGAIVNNGVIAKYNSATIKVGETSVTMNGVDGVLFDVIKVASVNTLAVSGDIEVADGTNTSAIAFSGVNFNDDVVIGKNVPANVAVASTLAGKTMTIQGVLRTTAPLNLKAGSIVDVQGIVAGAAGLVAETTDLGGVAKSAAPGYTTVFTTTQGVATKAANPDVNVDVTGFVISVVKTPFVEDEAEKYTQFAFVSGTLTVTPALGAGYAITTDAKVTATSTGGPVVIAPGVEFTQNIAGAYLKVIDTLLVEGKLTSKTDLATVGTVIGATYSVVADEVETYYAVDYNTGLTGIAGYKDKTVTLVGLAGYKAELAADLAVLEGEAVAKAGAAEFLTIPEGIVLTVNGGAAFDPAIIDKLDGKVITMKDGDCDPVGKYQVYSEDEDENITYCGFVTALNEATSGDIITLTAEYAADSLTIPEGITVAVDAPTGSLVIKKNLTVSNGATLTVTGNITVGDSTGKTKNTKFVVNGTADLSSTAAPAVFYTFTDGDAEAQKNYALQITSNGELIYRTTQTFPVNTVLVGVTYVDGTTTILTTLENALEAEATVITIPGEYTSEAAIDLGGATLTVTGNATIASIDVQDGQIDVTGTLTATVEGVYAQNGAASVALDGFVGTISDKAVADEYTFAIAAMTGGSLEVKNGVATVTGAAITVADKKTLKVDSGAELVIDETAILTLTGSMDVAGKLTVAKDKALTVVGDKLTISGDVEVIGDLTIGKSTVSGTILVKGDFTADDMKLSGVITVDDSEESVATATFNNVVVGTALLGAAPAIEGKAITLAAGKYIVQYPGANLGEKTVAALKKTEFYVNDNLYLTAYANNGEVKDVAADGVISAAFTVQGYDMTGVDVAANWKDNTGAAIDAATMVGDKAKIYFNGVQLTCQVVVSSTTGTSIFVDGVKYDSGKTLEGISVGKHTITVSINPGYKGTTTTTFNGKAVTDSFEVTSDMVGPTAKYVLSVTGDIVIDDGSDDKPADTGLGLTEILLIVLVILIAIMVVVLLIRLNRS